MYNYKPLAVILTYLTATLILFKYGPIDYKIHNENEFWAYMIYYISCVAAGYIFGVKYSLVFSSIKKEKLLIVPFALFAFISFIGALVLNANLAKQDSIFPDNIIRLVTGQISLLELGGAYYNRIEAGADFHGSFARNVLYFMLGWVRFVFVIYIFAFWPLLNFYKKFIGVLIILIPILSGITIGTNRSVFEPALLLLFTSIHMLLISRCSNNYILYNWSARVIKIGIAALLLAVVFFGASMSGRGADALYIESTSKVGDIAVNKVNDGFEGIETTGYMLLHYIVQGYYGFSLSLNEEFDSTYGFGHSPFLLRQAERVLGNDFSERTYQAKIDHIWSETRQWHSAFSQFANDVHFIGVGVVLFFISMIYSAAYMLAMKYRFREAVYLLPLISMFYLFLPANNQVFGYLETLVAFLVLVFTLMLRVRI